MMWHPHALPLIPCRQNMMLSAGLSLLLLLLLTADAGPSFFLLLLLMLLMAGAVAVACRCYLHLQQILVPQTCMITQHNVENILNVIHRTNDLRTSEVLQSKISIRRLRELHTTLFMKIKPIKTLQLSNLPIKTLQLSNVFHMLRSTEMTKTLQTDNELLDFVNLFLRFGPAVISELDATLLGRRGLHQL